MDHELPRYRTEHHKAMDLAWQADMEADPTLKTSILAQALVHEIESWRECPPGSWRDTLLESAGNLLENIHEAFLGMSR